VIILADGVRAGYQFGHVGDPNPTPFSVAAGAPRPFTITFPSAEWSNLANEGARTLQWELERSLDGGATWVGYIGPADGTNVMGKGGVIHPASTAVSWDGQAMLIRGGYTVGPAPYAVAIDVT
jgi:hypothetical protein